MQLKAKVSLKNQTAERKDENWDSPITLARNCKLQESSSQDCSWLSDSCLGSFLLLPFNLGSQVPKNLAWQQNQLFIGRRSKSPPPLSASPLVLHNFWRNGLTNNSIEACCFYFLLHIGKAICGIFFLMY